MSTGGAPWDQWPRPGEYPESAPPGYAAYPTAPPAAPRPAPGWIPPVLLAAAAVGVAGLFAPWYLGPAAGRPPNAFAGVFGVPLAVVLVLAGACGLTDLVRRRALLAPWAGVPALLAVAVGVVLTVRHWSDGAPSLSGRAALLYGHPNALGVLITEAALAVVQLLALAALLRDAYGGPAGRTGPLLIAAAAVVAASVAAAVALTVVVPVGHTAAEPGPGAAPGSPTTAPVAPPATSPPAAGGPAAGGPLTARSVTATCLAPPGQDASGAQFEYLPEYALDTDPESAWRCDGDGVGEQLRIDLGAPRTLTRIDVVPGFAKTDAHDGSDRYAQCRRLAAVRFDFDGTSVQQTFDTDPTDRTPQPLALPGIRTRAVTMTILATVPGTAQASGAPIDKIAVSTLTIVGS